MRRLIAVLLVLMMAQASATASLAEAGEIENYTRYTDYTPQQAEPKGLISGTDGHTGERHKAMAACNLQLTPTIKNAKMAM